MKDTWNIVGCLVVAMMIGFLAHMTISQNDWHKGFDDGAAIWRNDAEQCFDIRRLGHD